jgi:hypothetical protein
MYLLDDSFERSGAHHFVRTRHYFERGARSNVKYKPQVSQLCKAAKARAVVRLSPRETVGRPELQRVNTLERAKHGGQFERVLVRENPRGIPPHSSPRKTGARRGPRLRPRVPPEIIKA